MDRREFLKAAAVGMLGLVIPIPKWLPSVKGPQIANDFTVSSIGHIRYVGTGDHRYTIAQFYGWLSGLSDD